MTDSHKMTADELYKELSEGYAKEAGERDGAAGVFDPSEGYGLAETLAYQEGYDATSQAPMPREEVYEQDESGNWWCVDVETGLGCRA